MMRFALVLCACAALLLSVPASAEVVRQHPAYACKSFDAFVLFQAYRLGNDLAATRETLENGECISIPRGQEVHVKETPTIEHLKRAVKFSPKYGSYAALTARLALFPNDARLWWISQADLMTRIEMDQWVARMDDLTKQWDQERRQREAPKPKAPSPSKPRITGPKWQPIPFPMPAGRTERSSNPSLFFKEAKKSVWAVVALKKSAGGDTRPLAQGSAVAISPIHLVTNCHVAQDADGLVITQEAKQINVRLTAVHTSTDRCVLGSDELLPAHVPGVRSFSDIQIGERVFTVGSPRGLEHTLGDGLVSGLRTTKGGRYVQTSAPISPGSSGGGLFDKLG